MSDVGAELGIGSVPGVALRLPPATVFDPCVAVGGQGMGTTLASRQTTDCRRQALAEVLVRQNHACDTHWPSIAYEGMLGGSGVIHWVIFQPNGRHIAVAGAIANARSTAKCRAGVVSASGLSTCLRMPKRWFLEPKAQAAGRCDADLPPPRRRRAPQLTFRNTFLVIGVRRSSRYSLANTSIPPEPLQGS